MACKPMAAIVAGLICGMPAVPACAQEQASPQALNECTTLTDPARLQQCILTGQGARKIRGRLTSPRSPAPNAPIYQDAETPEKTLRPLPQVP